MTGRQFIDEFIENYGSEIDIPLMEGNDGAIIGLMFRFGQDTPVVAYDRRKVLRILMDKNGMTQDEAQKFHDYQLKFFTNNVWCFIDTPDSETQEHVPGPIKGEVGENSPPTTICGATGEAPQSGAGS